MISLNTRLLLVASLILVLFFGITGLTLDQLYRENAEQTQRNRLLGYVYEVITASEFSKFGKIIEPQKLGEVRFSIPHSGLYAQITQNQGDIVWRSSSLDSEDIPFRFGLDRGNQEFGTLEDGQGNLYYYYNFGISWDESVPMDKAYTFSVAENSESLQHNIANFRKSLWGSLSAVAILLLLVQGLIMRWGLSPLRQVTDDLKTIESGKKLALEGKYPPEIRRLTDDLNALLHSHHENLKRHRQTLGDLAHSLKTPLALLRSSAENSGPGNPLANKVQNQVARMTQIIEYQLQRAATAGRSVFAAAIEVKPIVDKITSSLNKVHAEKVVELKTFVSENAIFYGDADDLMEIIGNLSDNAYKWCEKRVVICVENVRTTSTRPGLSITVEDDGPGIPDNQIDQVLHRGIRADENVSGHGIGMAIINDITTSYGGKVHISKSKYGGCLIEVVLPGT